MAPKSSAPGNGIGLPALGMAFRLWYWPSGVAFRRGDAPVGAKRVIYSIRPWTASAVNASGGPENPCPLYSPAPPLPSCFEDDRTATGDPAWAFPPSPHSGITENRGDGAWWSPRGGLFGQAPAKGYQCKYFNMPVTNQKRGEFHPPQPQTVFW